METTKSEGTIREAVEHVKESLDDAADDVGRQLSGQAEILWGKAQKLYADAAALTRDSLREEPLITLAVTAMAGFALGVLWSWNRTDATDNRGMRRR
jgi:uncharacterized protein YjbJ (UPF0337 family)